MSMVANMPLIEHRVAVRRLDRDGFAEWFLTAAAEDPSSRAELRRVLAACATAMAGSHIRPIQERIYGNREFMNEILEMRRSLYAAEGIDSMTPVTFIEGGPVTGVGWTGIQIWGVAGAKGGTIDGADGESARLWESGRFRLLYLPLVLGKGPGGPAAQAERMFSEAGTLLSDNGFCWRHVVRTWIYLSRILDWYDEFNRVRTEYYRRHGLIDRNLLPSSTGIQGRHADEECCMSLLAIDADPGAVTIDRIRRTGRQDHPATYGSAFSRAAAIGMDGRRVIHISGTASINAAGKTLYEGRVKDQVIETLANVAALLDEQGGGLDSICSGTLFCKIPAVREAWREVVKAGCIPEIPVVPMIADICRRDLLVELEATAII